MPTGLATVAAGQGTTLCSVIAGGGMAGSTSVGVDHDETSHGTAIRVPFVGAAADVVFGVAIMTVLINIYCVASYVQLFRRVSRRV